MRQTEAADRQLIVPEFYLYYVFPSPLRTRLKVVDQFDCLDSKLLMHRAVSAIIGKAKKAHNCVTAIAYSLWYGMHYYNPDTASAPSEILTLQKSTVKPYSALNLRYLPLDTQLETLQRELNSSNWNSTTQQLPPSHPPSPWL